MRLQEILKEELDWGSGPDKDIFMSLKGLINKNNGVWKSIKQRWFVMNRLMDDGDKERESALNKRFFGIETKENLAIGLPGSEGFISGAVKAAIAASGGGGE